MSGVPLGAFLSAEPDSSIIAAVARTHMKELHTFSVGIEGRRELQAARCFHFTNRKFLGMVTYKDKGVIYIT